MLGKRASFFLFCGILFCTLSIGSLVWTEVKQVVELEEKKEHEEAIVTYLSGTAKAKEIGQHMWRSVKIYSRVPSGNKVKTLQRSRAELLLFQDNLIRMAPNTTIDLIKLFREEKKREDLIDLKISEGEVWSNLSALPKNTEFRITSPIATTSVRGTIFRMCVQPNKTTKIRVYKGEVEVYNPISRPYKGEKIERPHEVKGPREVSIREWMFILKEMEEIVISPDQKQFGITSFSEDDKEEQSDWIKWNKRRDALLLRD